MTRDDGNPAAPSLASGMAGRQDLAIHLAGIVKRYGATEALASLSLDVRRGEMFGLIGPDGAGKTTAIRLMCGLLRADAGEVRVLGRDPVREHREITRRIGYLSQRFSLYGDLTIDENIAFFAEIHGVRQYRARRDQLLEMTQLTPFRGRLAARLSGGMKQKLALACTLVHEPELILLDEPTTGVDPISRREFWKLLSEFLAHGVTILMSTPYLDEAERCTRVALVHEGRVLAADEPLRLRALISGPMVEVVAGTIPGAAETVRHLPHVLDAQTFGERLHVRLDGANDDAVRQFTRALESTPLRGLAVRQVPPSLEDVFIARLGGKESVSA
jgi:ABC-2 type transport system ATP-binding protein